METITIIAAIIALVFGIVNIILFFKLRKMCDNVKDIAASIKEAAESRQEKASVPETSLPKLKKTKFVAGEVVVILESGEQFRVTKVIENGDGSVRYYSDKFERCFAEDEIESIKVYWERR
jgi:predicted transcriptional regulator